MSSPWKSSQKEKLENWGCGQTACVLQGFSLGASNSPTDQHKRSTAVVGRRQPGLVMEWEVVVLAPSVAYCRMAERFLGFSRGPALPGGFQIHSSHLVDICQYLEAICGHPGGNSGTVDRGVVVPCGWGGPSIVSWPSARCRFHKKSSSLPMHGRGEDGVFERVELQYWDEVDQRSSCLPHLISWL